jgi:drug/metabolite transporter (DMT)-like permease
MSSVILPAVAPLTALLAFLLFGEQMKLIQLVGGVLILAAVLVASREKRPVLATANSQQTPV